MGAERLLQAPAAILFDLDGTLADTAPDLAAAVNKLRTDQGLKPAPYETLRPFASAGARGLIGAAFGITPQDAAYGALRDQFLIYYETDIANESVLFPGVERLLAALGDRGIAWGIVTNKAARLTDALVPRIGLQHADCVISGDTASHPKPHAAPLLEAARRIDVRPDRCWYVGDDLRDIEAGRAAGMATIAAAWGYCSGSDAATWDADCVLGMPMDIVARLGACAPSFHTT